LNSDGAASSTSAASEAVDTTRGSPNIGRGGSSGWIAIRTPTSSATGTIADRNDANRVRSTDAGTSSYVASASRNRPRS
jgi:hypothetical protein